MSELQILVNITRRQLIASVDQPFEAILPDFVQGDSPRVKIRCQEEVDGALRDVDMSGAAFQLGIGVLGARPTTGTFTVTFGANTTSALAYNCTAGQLATALNALASIISAGGVTVSGANGEFTVIFNSTGAQSTMTGNGSQLFPTSTVGIVTMRPGTGSVSAVQRITLLRNPAAYQDTFSNDAAPSVSISVLQEGGGGLNEVQRVSVGKNTIGGSFTLTLSGASSGLIPFDIDETTFANRLAVIAAIGQDNVRVEKIDAFTWDVEFINDRANQNIATLAVGANSLLYARTKSAELGLNTIGVQELLNGALSVTAVLSLRITPAGGDPFTAFSAACRVVNSFLDPALLVPSPAASYYTAAQSDARFLQIGNNLSDLSNAATARANLGLGGLATVADITQAILLFTGATASLPGTRGTVPAPLTGQVRAVLRGSAVFDEPIGEHLTLSNLYG